MVITDNKTLQRTLQSASGVLRTRLRIDTVPIKVVMEKEDIGLIEWVNTNKELAETLTKQGVRSEEILSYIARG